MEALVESKEKPETKLQEEQISSLPLFDSGERNNLPNHNQNFKNFLEQQLLQHNCPPGLIKAFIEPVTRLATMLFPLDGCISLTQEGGFSIKLSKSVQLKIQFPSQTKNQFLFSLLPCGEEKTLSFPRLEVIKSSLGIDLQECLPAFITDIYQSLKIKSLTYRWSRDAGFVPTIDISVIITKINIFQLEIDSLALLIRANFAKQNTFVQMTMRILWKGLLLEGEVPDKISDEWKLSAKLKINTSKKIADFLPASVNHNLPPWLQEQSLAIDEISGDISLRSKQFIFTIICRQGFELCKIQDTCITLSDIKFTLANRPLRDSEKNHEEKAGDKNSLQLKLSGTLMLGRVGLKFSVDVDARNFKIEGDMPQEAVEQLISLLKSLLGTDSDHVELYLSKLRDSIGSLHYSISRELLQFSSDSFSISLFKEPGSVNPWVVYFSYHCLPAQGQRVESDLVATLGALVSRVTYCNANVEKYGWTKGLKTTASIPLHKLMGGVLQTELYLPVAMTITEKESKFSGGISLPGEMKLGALTLNNISASCKLEKQAQKPIKAGITLAASLLLDLDTRIALKGELSLNIEKCAMKSISGSFTMSGVAVELLGIKLHNIGVNVQYASGNLSGGLTTSFSILEEAVPDLKVVPEEKRGNLMASVGTTGSVQAFKLEFPAHDTLSVKRISEMLLPPAMRPPYSAPIEVLDKLIPVKIGPVDDKVFIDALKNCEEEPVRSLLAKDNDRLIVSFDMTDLTAKIAGQIKYYDIFEAFILLDFSLYNNCILIGATKPVELLDGLLKISKSTYKGSRPPPIDVGGPVLYAVFPGLSNVEQCKDIRIHANARVEFFNCLMDAYIEMSLRGIEISLQLHADLALLVIDNKLLLIINDQLIKFETNLQLSLSFSNGLQLIGVSSRVNVNIPMSSSAGRNIQVEGQFSLKLLNLDEDFKFNITLESGILKTCHDFRTFVEQISRKVSDQIMGSKSEHIMEFDPGILFAECGNDQLSHISQLFEDLLFPITTSNPIPPSTRKQHSQLCLFHYLLRLNKPQTIQKAMVLITALETSLAIPDLKDDFEKTIKFAMAGIENTPLVSFCYLRFLEIGLEAQKDKDTIKLHYLALVQYFLGVLYTTRNVPMAIRFRERYDVIIENHCKQNNYITNDELLGQGIKFFVNSLTNFSRYKKNITGLKDAECKLARGIKFMGDPKPLKKKSTTVERDGLYLLPLYQLWQHRHTHHVLSANLSDYLARSNIGKFQKTQPLTGIRVILSTRLKEVLLSSIPSIISKDTQLSFEQALKNKMFLIALLEVTWQDADFRRELLSSDEKNQKKYSQLIKYCEPSDSHSETTINCYQQLARIYLDYEVFQNNGYLDPKLKEKFQHLIETQCKTPFFESLLGEYYLFYIKSRLEYCQGTLEEDPVMQLKCYLSSLNVPPLTYIRKLKLLPNPSSGTEKELTVNPSLLMAGHREISYLYEDSALHDKEKIGGPIERKHENNHHQCTCCQAAAKFHNIQYLKSMLVDEHCQILVGEKSPSMSNSVNRNLITNPRLREGLDNLLKEQPERSLSVLIDGLYTVQRLDIAFNMFRDWAAIQQDPAIQDLAAGQAIILKIDIIELLLTILDYGYIPAYFQLKKLIADKSDYAEDDDALFEEIYRLLNKNSHDAAPRIKSLDTPMLPPSSPTEKIKSIKIEFQDKGFYTVKINKRTEKFPGIDVIEKLIIFDLVKDPVVKKMLDSESKLIPFMSLDSLRNIIKSKIEGLHLEFPLPLRHYFAELCDKTCIFKSVSKNEKYVSWQDTLLEPTPEPRGKRRVPAGPKKEVALSSSSTNKDEPDSSPVGSSITPYRRSH